jgi:hypothetical protein
MAHEGHCFDASTIPALPPYVLRAELAPDCGRPLPRDELRAAMTTPNATMATFWPDTARSVER